MFLELLVAGFGALIWLSFIVVIIFGPDPLSYLLRSDNLNGAMILTMVVGAAYVLGIIVDRTYLPFWKHVDKRHRKRVGLKLNEYYKAQIVIAMRGNDRLNDLLSFYTSRIRILRASMVNFLVSAFLGLWAFWPNKLTPWFIFVVALSTSILSYIALDQLARKYYDKVIEANKIARSR